MNVLLIFYYTVALSFQPLVSFADQQNVDIKSIYLMSGADKDISYNVFELALKGMQKITDLPNKTIITIIDYSQPSSKERFYVFDIKRKQIIYKTLVAHGRNSGDEKAESFSNCSDSKKSCTGFFRTAETYYGKHGYSLSLDGLEEGINDNARVRSIVIHGAEYVSQEFIEKYGRLGRSWGCPALPVGMSKEIIDKISEGSCIFIYGNDPEYPGKSKFLNGE